MFSGASNLAKGVDDAFVFIFAVSFFFIIGITAFIIWTVIKFNRKKGHKPMTFDGSVKLEIIWTVIPTIIVMVMFWFGWKGFKPMREVPDDAMVIKAIGRMWEWEFDYGDGKLSKDLVVPIGVPVKLDLVAEDVNHSLFIPAFRVKEDVVPGYDNYLWFTATVLGEYELLCTEYCGLLHSAMIAKTKVVAQDSFDNWLNNMVATGNIPDHPGLAVLKANACLGCHSLDGSKLVGPSFKGVYGANRTIKADGTERQLVVDDDYILRAIYQPNDEIVKGYSKGLMQSYEKLITKEQVEQITEYLKTVK